MSKPMMSEKEKFEFMRDLILARRGYLVIGVHFPATCVVGQPIQKIWNKEREGIFRVTKKTTKRDWNEQLKLAKQQDKFAVNPSESFKDTEYFRVVRDDQD